MPRDADGGPVSVPGSGMHVMVSGDPKSGKSWIAGLITERLLDRGYRLCVLDPEGDYLALAERPEVLAFGDRLTLPPAPTIPGLLERHPFSIVLSLARLPPPDRAGYAMSVLAALEQPRLRTGIPHWIVVDEAQAVFREGQPSAAPSRRPTSALCSSSPTGRASVLRRRAPAGRAGPPELLNPRTPPRARRRVRRRSTGGRGAGGRGLCPA